jgi:hypothetical protein
LVAKPEHVGLDSLVLFAIMDPVEGA